MSTAQANKAMPAICNEGCGEQFEVRGFQTARLPAAVEKTYFTCSHCKHEYVAFYTDPGVRQLQDKIRRIQSQLQNPRADHAATLKKVNETKAAIKAGMDRIRAEVEVGAAPVPRLILVVGRDVTQARNLWKDLGLRDKYPKSARVKYVSRNPAMLDGLDPFSMLIVLVGQHGLNPIMEGGALSQYIKLGATVVREEGP